MSTAGARALPGVERKPTRGRTLGRLGEFRVAVRGGVLGARVQARVEERRRSGIEAVLVEERAPSAFAARPRIRARRSRTCST